MAKAQNAHDDWMELVTNKDRTPEEVQSRTQELVGSYDLKKGTIYRALDSSTSMTPLMLASHFGRGDVAEALIQNNADVNFVYDIFTSLQIASIRGNLLTVKLLVESGAEVNKSHCYPPSIHLAARNGHLDIVQYLHKERGVSVNQLGDNNHTPLYYAANYRKIDVAKYLLGQQADTNMASSSWNETPLYRAADNSHADMVSLLVQAKADVNIMAKAGGSFSDPTPLRSCLGMIVRNVDYHSQGKLNTTYFDPNTVPFYKNITKLLLLSPEYPLHINSDKEKALVLKVLQESPYLIPYKEPLIQDASGQFSKDIDISTQLVKNSSYPKTIVSLLNSSVNDLSLFNIIFEYLVEGNQPQILKALSAYIQKMSCEDTDLLSILNPESDIMISSASISKDTSRLSSELSPPNLQEEAKSDREVISASIDNGIEEEHDIGPEFQYIEPVIHLSGEADQQSHDSHAGAY